MHEARADEQGINRDTRPARLAKVLWFSASALAAVGAPAQKWLLPKSLSL
jgi:hypothetical protein